MGVTYYDTYSVIHKVIPAINNTTTAVSNAANKAATFVIPEEHPNLYYLCSVYTELNTIKNSLSNTIKPNIITMMDNINAADQSALDIVEGLSVEKIPGGDMPDWLEDILSLFTGDTQAQERLFSRVGNSLGSLGVAIAEGGTRFGGWFVKKAGTVFMMLLSGLAAKSASQQTFSPELSKTLMNFSGEAAEIAPEVIMEFNASTFVDDFIDSWWDDPNSFASRTSDKAYMGFRRGDGVYCLAEGVGEELPKVLATAINPFLGATVAGMSEAGKAYESRAQELKAQAELTGENWITYENLFNMVAYGDGVRTKRSGLLLPWR